MHGDARIDGARRAGRSASTVNLKGTGAEEEEKEESVKSRRLRAKSVFDLRKDNENEDEYEADSSKLKAIISFFRNLRPNKEKEADKVVSLTNKEKSPSAQEKKEKKEDNDDKLSLGERYRLWREKKQKSKKEVAEEEEQNKKKKARKKIKERSRRSSASKRSKDSDVDSDCSSDSDDEVDGEDGSDVAEHTAKNEKGTLPRRKGLAAMLDHPNGSFSDLSLDNLELPPENSNRDLDHRIQAISPAERAKQQEKARAKGKKSARRQKESDNGSEGNESEQSQSKRRQRDKVNRNSGGFFGEADTRSIASERTDRSDDSAESGHSASNFSRLRRRFRGRKNSTIQEVEELNHGDRDSSAKANKKKNGKTPRGQDADDEDDERETNVDDSESGKKKKSKLKKKKKNKEKNGDDLSMFDDSDDDPEIIVEEMMETARERRSSYKGGDLTPRENKVHLTYLSSDSDNETKIIVDRWKQNFIEEKKGFRFLRRGRKEKKSNTATRITPLTEGSDDHYRLNLPLLPDEPWDPVEYNHERHSDQLDEDDFISVEQLQNLLADPSEKGNVAVIDTREYNDFLQSHLVFAKHVTEFQNAEAQILYDVCSTFSTFILYDSNGRTLSLMDSQLSLVYDFLKSGASSWRIFIVDGGHDLLRQQAGFLLSTSKKKQRFDLTPSSCEKGYLMWANTQDISLLRVIKTYAVSHVVTFEGDVDAKVPVGVESVFVKVDADTTKLYDHLEQMLKFILLGKEEDEKPSRVLIVCNAADNRASAVVIAFVMFKHHWNLQDAYTHIAVRRGAIDLGKNNVKALQKFEKKLFGRQITKSAPRLKNGKAQEKKKKEEEEEEEDLSDLQSARDSKDKKKKKKKKKKSTGLSDDDSEDFPEDIAFPDPTETNNNNNNNNNNTFKDDELEDRRKGKRFRKILDVNDDALSNASSLSSHKNGKDKDPSPSPVSGRKGKKNERESGAKSFALDDDAEEVVSKKKTKSKPKKEKQSSKTNDNTVTEFSVHDDSESDEEKETPRPKPKPKKRNGLFRLKKNHNQEEVDGEA